MKTESGRRYTIRLNSKDEKQRKVIQMLDDVNATIPINQFVTDALIYYIECLENGILSSDTVNADIHYVTREEMESYCKGQKDDIRKELFEEFIRLIGANTVVNQFTAAPMQVQPAKSVAQSEGHSNTNDSMNEVLDDVMKRS